MFLLAEAGPNWAEIVTAVGTGVVALGLFLAALQLRDARKIRSAEIVRLLAEQWDHNEMRSARRLVAKYTNDEEMAQALRSAKATQSDDYFHFTKHLNFWEQVGMSYSDHSRGLAVVDVMFGEAIDEAWGAWEPVIPAVWGEHTDIGRSFAALVAKIRRRRRWLCYRRKLRRFLLTPYYDRVPPGGMKPCR